MSSELLSYVIAGLAFITIAGLGLAYAGPGRGRQSRRMKTISEGVRTARAAETANALRRKQMDATTKVLREREVARRRQRSIGRSLDQRIRQAGLKISVPVFYAASLLAGVLAFCGLFFLAGLNKDVMLAVAMGISFAVALGAPRWLLGMRIAAHQKKFIGQFADAIDIIVRGVKSGLPLNECLRVIARESPQPLAGEFQAVCDAVAMGVELPQALDRLYQQTPIQEVNFFNIVLNIQQRAGGNLSEALNNLSNVLRSRKLLREKIKALSSEAKASAMIIGSLPVIVMLLVYVTTPAYIMSLFTTDLGHLILLTAAVLMATGIFIMRSMINFKI